MKLKLRWSDNTTTVWTESLALPGISADHLLTVPSSAGDRAASPALGRSGPALLVAEVHYGGNARTTRVLAVQGQAVEVSSAGFALSSRPFLSPFGGADFATDPNDRVTNDHEGVVR